MITSDLMHGIYYLLIEWNKHMSREFPSTSATNMIFEINQILPQQPVKQLQKAVFLHTLLWGPLYVMSL